VSAVRVSPLVEAVRRFRHQDDCLDAKYAVDADMRHAIESYAVGLVQTVFSEPVTIVTALDMLREAYGCIGDGRALPMLDRAVAS
jgi:hypothetical protein